MQTGRVPARKTASLRRALSKIPAAVFLRGKIREAMIHAVVGPNRQPRGWKKSWRFFKADVERAESR